MDSCPVTSDGYAKFMDTENTRTYSRRKAFRFSCREFAIRYRTAYDERKAHLINVSTTGCLFRDQGHELAVGEKILLIFPLWEDKPPFETNGHVVRVRDNDAAAHFKIIEQDTVKNLRLFIFQNQESGGKTLTRPAK